MQGGYITNIFFPSTMNARQKKTEKNKFCIYEMPFQTKICIFSSFRNLLRQMVKQQKETIICRKSVFLKRPLNLIQHLVLENLQLNHTAYILHTKTAQILSLASLKQRREKLFQDKGCCYQSELLKTIRKLNSYQHAKLCLCYMSTEGTVLETGELLE